MTAAKGRAMRNAVDVFDALDKPRRLAEWIRLESPTGDPNRVLFCRGEEGARERFAEIATDRFRTSLLGYIVSQPPDAALRRAGQFFIQQAEAGASTVRHRCLPLKRQAYPLVRLTTALGGGDRNTVVRQGQRLN